MLVGGSARAYAEIRLKLLAQGVFARGGRPPRKPAPRQAVRRLHNPRVIMLVAFAATSIINYAFSLAAGWLLLPGDFGLLAFAQTLLLIGGLALNSGVPWFLTRALLGLPIDQRGAVVRGGLVANTGLASAGAVLLMALYLLGPLRSGLENAQVATLVVAAFVPMGLLAVARSAAQGLEHFAVVATLTVAEIATKAASGVGLVMLGRGAAGAIAGFAVGATLGAVLGLAYLWYFLAIGPRGPITFPALRATLPLFGALLGMALILNLDLLAMKLLVGDERLLTGYYQAGSVLANIPYYLVTAALLPILFTQLARDRSLARGAARLGETVVLTVLLILPLEFVLIVAPERALGTLFPAAYAPGATSLRLLALGNALLIFVALLSTAFQAVGRADVPSRLLLLIALVEPVALVAAVPRWHGLGAATIFVVAAATALLGLGAAIMYEIGHVAFLAARDWLARYAGVLVTSSAAGIAARALGQTPERALLIAAPIYVLMLVVFRLMPGLSRRIGGRYPEATVAGED